jgi:hypothetical protein
MSNEQQNGGIQGTGDRLDPDCSAAGVPAGMPDADERKAKSVSARVYLALLLALCAWVLYELWTGAHMYVNSAHQRSPLSGSIAYGIARRHVYFIQWWEPIAALLLARAGSRTHQYESMFRVGAGFVVVATIVKLGLFWSYKP